MSNNNWSEHKVDQLLSQVPKLQDTRSKEDVLNRLKEDPRLNGSEQVLKKGTKPWIPTAVAAAAVLIVCLLAATMINKPATDTASMSEEAKMDSSAKMESSNDAMKSTSINEPASESAKVTGESEENSFAAAGIGTEEQLLNAVYPTDLGEYTAFHIGMVAPDAIVVPVTFLIPNRTIANDFGGQQPTSLQLYNKYADELDEESLGFSEYHPYAGEFIEEGPNLIHKLPSVHDYDMSSAASSVYNHSIKETFYGYSEISFQNEEGKQAVFDQVGPKKPELLSNGHSFTSYYSYVNPNGGQFLVPNSDSVYTDIKEAMESMKTSPNDFLKSVIPDGVDYEVVDEKGLTRIRFTEVLDLEQLDPKSAANLIEGILLTNASFGGQVQLENIQPSIWNGLDFSKALPIPAGANKYSWE